MISWNLVRPANNGLMLMKMFVCVKVPQYTLWVKVSGYCMFANQYHPVQMKTARRQNRNGNLTKCCLCSKEKYVHVTRQFWKTFTQNNLVASCFKWKMWRKTMLFLHQPEWFIFTGHQEVSCALKLVFRALVLFLLPLILKWICSA